MTDDNDVGDPPVVQPRADVDWLEAYYDDWSLDVFVVFLILIAMVFKFVFFWDDLSKSNYGQPVDENLLDLVL